MSKAKKVTYSLPPEIVSGIQDAVDRGEASSGSAVVREAVSEYLARARDARLREAYEQAAADDDFRRDNDEVLIDFAPLDAESVE